jgi:hypothetical protein
MGKVDFPRDLVVVAAGVTGLGADYERNNTDRDSSSAEFLAFGVR